MVMEEKIKRDLLNSTINMLKIKLILATLLMRDKRKWELSNILITNN
jgi:hypothetical protein